MKINSAVQLKSVFPEVESPQTIQSSDAATVSA